jgi:hypothetical protein
VSTSTSPLTLERFNIIASPTVASAAATVIIKMMRIWDFKLGERERRKRLIPFSIISTDIKTKMRSFFVKNIINPAMKINIEIEIK